METWIGSFLKRDKHSIHQCGVRSARQRLLLSTAHLGGRDHLHRLGQLADVANRFDPSPYVLRVRHSKSMPGRLEFPHRALKLRLELLIELFLLAN